MQSILLATDGSQSAERARAVAARLAKMQSVPLWIVNVTDGVELAAEQLAEFSAAEHLSQREMVEALSLQLLVKVKEQTEAEGVRDVRIESRRGDIARTILDLADEKGAGLLVVGKRGLGTLTGLLVGSVTQKLVSVAPCAVVVVP